MMLGGIVKNVYKTTASHAICKQLSLSPRCTFAVSQARYKSKKNKKPKLQVVSKGWFMDIVDEGFERHPDGNVIFSKTPAYEYSYLELHMDPTTFAGQWIHRSKTSIWYRLPFYSMGVAFAVLLNMVVYYDVLFEEYDPNRKHWIDEALDENARRLKEQTERLKEQKAQELEKRKSENANK